MMTETEEHYERLLAEVCREREKYNGLHQIAVMEIERLRNVLEEALSFYDKLLEREHSPGEAAILDKMATVLNRVVGGSSNG